MTASLPNSDVTAAGFPTFVVVAFGSLGDILPLAGLARALQRRGHSVWFLAPQPYQTLALSRGLTFKSILDASASQAVLDDSRLWHPRHGFDVMWPAILQASMETIKILEPLAASRNAPCLVGGTMALGARVANERWGWSHATVHISPCWVFSALRPPLFYGLGWIKYLPPRWRGKVWAWTDRNLLDRVCGAGLNAWRSKFDLPPVRRIVGRWSASPQCVLGLFPSWFSKPQRDWPRHLQLAGFLRDDGGGGWVMSPRLDKFLGPKPEAIVFMAGSQMLHADLFFRVAALACARIGRKALFLAPGTQENSVWPKHVHVETYVPLGQILPRCAAIVSHPGIGTIAQALAAGVPQLLTPYAFDHFDNARLAVELGVAKVLAPDAGERKLAYQLQALLSDGAIAQACRAAKERMSNEIDAAEICCVTIEQLRAATVDASPA
jgi:rhamnosyltransferase subunit B